MQRLFAQHAELTTAVIAGGGVAGPAAALALGRIGIRSTVVESHPGPADGVGTIITLAANGLDALRTLGAGDQVLSDAQVIDEVRMADASGHEFARYPGGGHVLPRDRLARLLTERAASAGTEIRYGAAVSGMDSSPTGVTVHLDDGSTIRADLLIGADGIRSTVRSLIDREAPRPVFEGVLGFGAAVEAAATHAERGVMNFVFGQRFLGYWRLPDGRVCWYGALPGDELGWAELTATAAAEWLERLRAAYAGHVPGADLMEQTTADELVMTGPTLRMPPVPRWHRDRAVLVGDAVHAPSSSSGQGASLALESAVELARCLRDAVDVSAAFRRYESIRRPRVEAVAAMAAAANDAKAGRAPRDVPTFDPTRHRIDFDRPVVV